MKINKPKTYYEFKNIHYKILNDIYNELCFKVQKMKNKIRKIYYYVNTEIIAKELELNSYKNKNKYDLIYDYNYDNDKYSIIEKNEVIIKPNKYYDEKDFIIGTNETLKN